MRDLGPLSIKTPGHFFLHYTPPEIQEPAYQAACMWPEFRTSSHAHPFSPSHTHETMQREIEKQRIKEEILISGIVRRRVLEAEARHELMMEMGLASQSSGMGFELSTGLPMLGAVGEWRSVEERIIPSLAEKKTLGSGGFEAWPFQRRFDDLIRISDVRPAVPEGAKQKKRIILQVEPLDEDVAGSKRKASTLPAGLDSSESPSTDEKGKAEWFCSVCHVSATSQQDLKEHLIGKKHKSKEATLRAQRAGKNYSVGLFPKNAATKSIEVLVSADSSCASGSPRRLNSDDVMEVVPEAQKKNRFKFWCEMCRVGSHSKKIMKSHEIGKRHVKRVAAQISQKTAPTPSS